MCLGIPGRVVGMVDGYGDQLALVAVEGASRKVNIGLLDEGAVGPGDWVLIHMGFAVERVDAAKAAQARVGLELLGRGTGARHPDLTITNTTASTCPTRRQATGTGLTRMQTTNRTWCASRT